MKKFCLFFLLSCSPLFALDQNSSTAEKPAETENVRENIECKHCCNNPSCPHHAKEQERRLNDKQLQQLAVTTLAGMAQGILNIGWDPHNPQNVANNVTNVVGQFANFIALAINTKSIDIQELLSDKEFIEVCKRMLIKNAETVKKEQTE